MTERRPVPDDGVVWCEKCQRWTKLGQPYERLSPGVFVHRHCPGVLRVLS